ncbi:alpha/beta hydrolase [Streptomyces sp. NPDC014894]|uniref:alpha/beta hydrolase n=1 Tax=unclassified Streptomyces TaxID=2593676 RepID=UPI0036F54055
MTSLPTSSLALVLSASAVAAVLTTAAAPGARAGDAGIRDPAPAPRWTGCAQPGGPENQLCADLSVPVDHEKPDGPRMKVVVSRVESDRPEARRGTLLVLAGGPGSSGVDRLAQKGKALLKEMNGAYDLVTLDPRGVKRSTTASCRLPEADRFTVNFRPWPGPDGKITENADRARRVARECAEHGGPELRSLTSANQVRDIELLRRALGVEKLSAWGNSYGAYVGALYAQKHPERTDRWVLDSSGDPNPDRVARNWLANMARATEYRFPDFAAWAADPARDARGLRLARRAEEVRPLVLALAAELDRKPRRTTTEGVPLTGNGLRQALQLALYHDDSFESFGRLVRSVRDPEGVPVLPGALAGPMADEEAAVSMAVVCNDVRWPASVGAYERAVAENRARYPLTAGMPANLMPCSFWKEPAEKPDRITDEGPSNILMIQSLRDPATPHFGALKMREALGRRARMVSVDQGGHGVYLGLRNACGDRTVTEFLTTGKRPARDAHCPR